MYTDEDLDLAVKKGIFTESSVSTFRTQLELSHNAPAVDEENFRLISGFNDIFVVIACSLLLFSAVAALRVVDELLALTVFSLLAWGLAEFFIIKRKMALPAIVLLLSFVGGVFTLSMYLFESVSTYAYVISTALSALAAYIHYLRFQVPITVAAGTAAVAGFFIASVLSIFPDSKDWVLAIVFVCGVATFFIAMYWDTSDLDRQTRRSDVAFWLHLLSAPLIVHPVFTYLGILDGKESIISMVIIALLYVLMTLISIVIDRRAFMVSSLIYVLYAISNLLKAYGAVGYSFAVTGVCIGSALLLLSAFWHPVRKTLVQNLSSTLQNYLPKLH
ncbi:MAG: hypothetical protein ABUK11_00610 [Mariprofundaceae bacterium]